VKILEPSAKDIIEAVPLLVKFTIGYRVDVDLHVEALAPTKEEVDVIPKSTEKHLRLVPYST
jgi:hypothetical protein